MKHLEYTYIDPALPKEFDGFTVMFLSDLHIDGDDALVDPVCAVLDTIEADLCVLGGDYRLHMGGSFRRVMSH